MLASVVMMVVVVVGRANCLHRQIERRRRRHRDVRACAITLHFRARSRASEDALYNDNELHNYDNSNDYIVHIFHILIRCCVYLPLSNIKF